MRNPIVRAIPFLLGILLLVGCDFPVLWTKGPIAEQQKDLILISVLLMLIVVIPVLILTFVFAWRYRASNTKAPYTPDWDHNTKLEIIWWSIPVVIISILAVITWKSSHELDPYKPIVSSQKPLEIQVIALDWKWLFIYPEQDLAVVSHIRIPTGIPINFKITAQAPMNAFWVPHLAGQIYAMEGMQTLLHVVADEPGEFMGVSANFSGAGFNGMKFITKAVSAQEFQTWVDSVKQAGDTLSRSAYEAVAKPSENEPIHTWATVEKGLFLDIMMRYMMPPMENSKSCCHRKED